MPYNEQGQKYCPGCQEWKPPGAFSRNKNTSDGLQSRCTDCNARYRDANRDTMRQRRRERWHANREENVRKLRERYHADPERYREAMRQHRRGNPEKVKASEEKRKQTPRRIAWKKEYLERSRESQKQRWREYSRQNREYLRARGREYYQKNREEISRKYREWRIANADSCRVRGHRYRSRHRSAIGDFTLRQWEDLKRQYDYTCLCCGKQEPDIKLVPDHVIPLTWEGSSNLIENIQPLCTSCNSTKRDWHATDYRTLPVVVQMKLFKDEG